MPTSNSPLVSVIISVHNGQNTLSKTLGSISQQTYKHLEIIAVNDASKDATQQILESYTTHPIKIINNPIQLGLTKSLNKAIKQASGEYIARIDADDTWHSQKITKQINYLISHPKIGLLGTLYTNNSKKIKLPASNQDIKNKIWLRNPFGHSCVIFKKELFDRAGGYHEKLTYAQDRDLWFRFLPHTQMANLPEYLVSRSVGKTNSDKQKKQMLANIQMIRKYTKIYKPGFKAYFGLTEPSLIYIFRLLPFSRMRNRGLGTEGLIILLPKKLKLTGGTSTFARKFKQQVQKHNHKVIFKWQANYDVLLVSPRAPLWQLIHAKLTNKTIIHRLDGVYYPNTSAGKLWRLHNLPLWITRNFFADKIIYQSQFSKKSCEKYLPGLHKKIPTQIIYNGVDTNLFSPDGNLKNLRDNPKQKIFITWSRFRREDQIIPLNQAFKHYRQHMNQNSKLVLIGDIEINLFHELNFLRVGHLAEGEVGAEEDKRVKNLSSETGITYLDKIPNHQIPNYARSADCFVISHLNPPCPNNVIEAMACGLPIAGTNTGAMSELVTNNGHLTDASHPEKLAQAMHKCIQEQDQLSQASRQVVLNKLSLNKMTGKYISTLSPYRERRRGEATEQG